MDFEIPQIDTSERRPPARKPAAPRTNPTGCVLAALATLLCLGLAVLVTGVALVPPGPEAFWSDAAEDLEEQYRLVVEAQAPQIDRAIRAGAVAEAYLQAKDREGYRKWKAIADRHMRAAGMPAMR